MRIVYLFIVDVEQPKDEEAPSPTQINLQEQHNESNDLLSDFLLQKRKLQKFTYIVTQWRSKFKFKL